MREPHETLDEFCDRMGWMQTTLPSDVTAIDCLQGARDTLAKQKFVLQPDGTYLGNHYDARITDRYLIPNFIRDKDDPKDQGRWEVRGMVIEYYRPT